MHTSILKFDENNNAEFDGRYLDIRNDFKLSQLELKDSTLSLTLTNENKSIIFEFSGCDYLNIDSMNFVTVDNSLYYSDIHCFYDSDTLSLISKDGKIVHFDSKIFDNINQPIYFKLETKNGITYKFIASSFKCRIM